MLRRPLLFTVAGFTAAILIGYYGGLIASICLGLGAFAVAIISDKREKSPDKKRIIAWLLLISYCAGGIVFWWNVSEFNNQTDRLSPYFLNDGVTMEGTITDWDRKRNSSGEEYIQATIKTKDTKILLKYYGEYRAVPGMHITATGQLSKPQGRRNPGCFDYNLYLKSIGITATMTAKSIDITPGDEEGISGLFSHVRGRLFMVRESFIDRIAEGSNEETAAIMKAVMFGDKGELSEETLEVFQKNGTAHILAVSGLHIGIIYAFLFRIWRGKKGWFFLIFNLAFFGCYAVMADFSPSVIRAVIMVLLHVFANIKQLRYDLNNAAFAVMTGVLICNPFMLFNTGFQMSFLAVLTMNLVMPFVKNIYSGMFLGSLVVQIGLGPFIIYNFNYLSLLAILINVPVIALAGIIVPMGLVCMFMPFLTPGLDILCSILTWMNQALQIDGITTFQVVSPPLWLMTFYYLGLLAFATEEGRLAILRAGQMPDKIRYILRKSAIILAVSLCFSALGGDGFQNVNLTFVDVGQGDCMCVKSEGILPRTDRVYLIDGGGNDSYNLGSKTLKPYLLKNGMSHVDGAFVTHLHTDHYKGICELAREGMIRRLYVYEGNKGNIDSIMSETGMKRENIVLLQGGQNLTLADKGFMGSEEIELEVLAPEKKTDSEYRVLLEDEKNENAMSLIFRLNYRYDPMFGEDKNTSLLVTGDIDQEGEKELLQEEGDKAFKADILKVAHHGSKYSSSDEFLDAVAPGIAVIQVGKNNYGHPTPEVLEKLNERKTKVYRNDLQGAIGFEIKRGRIYNICYEEERRTCFH